TDRRRVELALEVGRPYAGVARGGRTGAAGDRERALELADATGAKPPRELAERRAVSARAVEGPVAAQLERPGTLPPAGGRIQHAVAHDAGDEARVAADLRAGEPRGEHFRGRGGDERELGT